MDMTKMLMSEPRCMHVVGTVKLNKRGIPKECLMSDKDKDKF